MLTASMVLAGNGFGCGRKRDQNPVFPNGKEELVPRAEERRIGTGGLSCGAESACRLLSMAHRRSGSSDRGPPSSRGLFVFVGGRTKELAFAFSLRLQSKQQREQRRSHPPSPPDFTLEVLARMQSCLYSITPFLPAGPGRNPFPLSCSHGLSKRGALVTGPGGYTRG
jgi:hypothetical protein